MNSVFGEERNARYLWLWLCIAWRFTELIYVGIAFSGKEIILLYQITEIWIIEVAIWRPMKRFHHLRARKTEVASSTPTTMTTNRLTWSATTCIHRKWRMISPLIPAVLLRFGESIHHHLLCLSDTWMLLLSAFDPGMVPTVTVIIAIAIAIAAFAVMTKTASIWDILIRSRHWRVRNSITIFKREFQLRFTKNDIKKKLGKRVEDSKINYNFCNYRWRDRGIWDGVKFNILTNLAIVVGIA